MIRTVSFIATAVIALSVSQSAAAKEYNQAAIIPSDTQALINRIQADIAATGEDEGFYGSFEDDCSSLDIGTSNDGSAPDQQVIIADKIVNIGGRCRVIRSSGGFQQVPSGSTPDNLTTPDAIPFD